MSLAALETNIFNIQNLGELTARYKLYRVKGLRPDQNEYYQNCQYLTKRFSYAYKSPVLTIQRDDETFLVVRDDISDIPGSYNLVRQRVLFEAASNLIDIDFTKRNFENDLICTRFLQFSIQESLFRHPSLWQPASGKPFFEYRPHRILEEICYYRGFSVRVTPTAAGSLGIVLDVTSKAVGRDPLPSQLTRDTFRYWKDKTVVYHYGHQWYEIQISALDDRNCGEYEIEDEKQWIRLIDYAIRQSRKPIPRELQSITPQDSVVLYFNNQNQERSAIARLCYPVYGTDDGDMAANNHRESILDPDSRRASIRTFAQAYLPLVQFGDINLNISLSPEETEVQMFNVPDQRFGQNKILSTVGSKNASHVSLDHLGNTRRALLRDPGAGFFSRSLLDRQYLILPQSVYQTYGGTFLKDLAREVESFYPHGGKYKPEVIAYPDEGKRTFANQGTAILQAIDAAKIESGYALVMIHHIVDRQPGHEDQLAGMVIQKLRERADVASSVIHSKISGMCYVEHQGNTGEREYVIDNKKRGKYSGYLKNIALNKVLLTNQKWPFILDKKLNADITIGIDIKQHTAGLVVVSNGGENIQTLIRTSRQKEKLMKDQMRDYLIEVLAKEAQLQPTLIRSIVIHRDGRAFQSEILGIQQALEILCNQGIVDTDARVTVLEISKSSPTRLRLFDVTTADEREVVVNPQVGCYYIINELNAYLCSTGRAFNHEGTSRPLAVRRVYGTLGMRECLEDLYALTTLAWSKPDDCSRNPITLKLCDRYLTEDATGYDEDALVRAEVLAELEIDTDE